MKELISKCRNRSKYTLLHHDSRDSRQLLSFLGGAPIFYGRAQPLDRLTGKARNP